MDNSVGLVLVSNVSILSKFPHLARWSTWMRAQSWSERTIADRANLVARVATTANVPANALTTDDVLSFLSQSTFSAASRQTYHASLRAWFRWLVASGIRDDDPMADIPKPRAGRRNARHLTTAHLEHLLGTRMHKRTRTMILLAAYQGLRAFEIAKFQSENVDQISREVEVLGKAGVYATLPLHPVIESECDEYGPGWWFPQWTANRDSDRSGHILGASVTTIVSAAMKRAGVPGTCHSLRHWHATELLRSGVDSRVTQQLMRHASLATTQQYMHVDDSQRREALERLPNVA